MACADVDMDIHGEDYDWAEPSEDNWNEPHGDDRREPHRRDGRGADTDDWKEPHRGDEREAPVVQHYQALEFVPDEKGPLHDLLQKQPAVLGSLQIMSGLFSVGVGIIFAATQNINDSLLTLFRASHLSGVLFIIAGFVSNLLFKYPGLLSVSLMINCGCIVVAVSAMILMSVDLILWDTRYAEHWGVELFELCVVVLEVLLSAILCFWFSKEKRAKSP
ncbi:hypothetical protein E3U43_020111 [Larimichthys crocea]|uniref:Uncharacterized protein n=1 Tax=Larimichthys crocea TaxID=215358 RepID=A0ACD3QVF9_LARCR|nr:hypothetical protein E3U43_020111 [Larimichthys crocea]